MQMDKLNSSETESSSERKLLNQKKELRETMENLTEKEAATFLRISTVSLWRARKNGLITFRRVMGKIIYTPTDLSDFLERSKRGGFGLSEGKND